MNDKIIKRDLETDGPELIIHCRAGDVVDEEVDLLVSTGNINLNMSGGVNGEILRRGGREVQKELHDYLKENNIKFVGPGTVLKVGPGPVKAKHLLYAVAIDVWYDSSVELVAETITKCLNIASEVGAKTVAIPALATGYGHLEMEEFAEGLQKALNGTYPGVTEVRVVLRDEESVVTVSKGLDLLPNIY